MHCVYIVDQDKRFAARLGQALSRKCANMRFLSAGTPMEMADIQGKLGQTADLLVYTVEQFPDFEAPPSLPVLRLRDKPSLHELYGDSLMNALAERQIEYFPDADTDSGEPVEQLIYRLAGVSIIAAEIETVLADSGMQQAVPSLKTILLYSSSNGRITNLAWERLLASELNAGRRVIGLPLASPHLLRAPTLLLSPTTTDRADLSALLLRLQYDDVEPKQLLPYLQPSGQGCLAMAGLNILDDINEIKSDVLVRLLVLLQQALAGSDELTSILILTAGLSVNRVRKLLPHCNEFITMSDPDAVEIASWQAVLNDCLNQISGTMRHREMWDEMLTASD